MFGNNNYVLNRSIFKQDLSLWFEKWSPLKYTRGMMISTLYTYFSCQSILMLNVSYLFLIGASRCNSWILRVSQKNLPIDYVIKKLCTWHTVTSSMTTLDITDTLCHKQLQKIYLNLLVYNEMSKLHRLHMELWV